MKNLTKIAAGSFVGFALAVAIACSSSFGCHLTPPVTPIVDAGDAGTITCKNPSDPPACACDILAGASCREGQPTALGETCTAGSRSRLLVLYAADEEQRSISCIIGAKTVAQLRAACKVCLP